jgi:transcription elongation factor Elf1
MKDSVFVWTCPACGEAVSTVLPEEDEAILVCGACETPFDEQRGSLAVPGPSAED